jgi:hypothetical protein
MAEKGNPGDRALPHPSSKKAEAAEAEAASVTKHYPALLVIFVYV